MIVLPATATDQTLLRTVQRWADALSAGDYTGAVSLLTAEGNEREWPPGQIEEVITRYQPGPTPPARGHREVTRWPTPRARPDVVGMIEYDLDIEGVLSDLTAIFWLRQVPGGLALELYDIHVL